MAEAVIYNGDCLEVMRELPDQSVNCCVTSPPYYGMRDYGVDGQIGLESTLNEYIEKMVEVFREVKRVLRDDGTVWVNIGDTYGSSGGDTYSGFNERYFGVSVEDGKQGRTYKKIPQKNTTGLKPKNLLGVPWRLAFAMQADGWYWRDSIVWNKTNPMPESVTDRCVRSHEHILMFSKCPKYHYDHLAIQEPSVTFDEYARDRDKSKINNTPGQQPMGGLNRNNYEYRNKRSVWMVATSYSKLNHFAIFPSELIEPCIKSGCPDGGVVLDPFAGTGTTGKVATGNGRNAILIELNPDTAAIIHDELGLLGVAGWEVKYG